MELAAKGYGIGSVMGTPTLSVSKVELMATFIGSRMDPNEERAPIGIFTGS